MIKISVRTIVPDPKIFEDQAYHTILNQLKEKIENKVRCPICNKKPLLRINLKTKDLDVDTCHEEVLEEIRHYLNPN